MDVEIVKGSEPPSLRVRPAPPEAGASPSDPDSAVQKLADSLVALGYPEWIRECARTYREVAEAAPALVFELACKHEGTVSAFRAVGPKGAYVECTRCACRLNDADDDQWQSPPRYGWPREAPRGR